MTKTAKGTIVALLAGFGLLLTGVQTGTGQQGLKVFISLEQDCGSAGCAPNAPVCCYEAPEIVVEV